MSMSIWIYRSGTWKEQGVRDPGPSTPQNAKLQVARAFIDASGSPPPVDRETWVPGDYLPDATTTGPLPGTVFTQWGADGATSRDFNVTANNQIVDSLEVWGSINVGSFANVVIQNCIIHGTLVRGTQNAAINFAENGHGLLVKDCLFVTRPGNNNEWCQGMRGGNYTMKRCEMKGWSDGVGLTSQLGNVTLLANWIHDGWYNEWTAAQNGTVYPTQAANYTHNDGIQFHIGKNYIITGNRIGGQRSGSYAHGAVPSLKDLINADDDCYNSAMLIKQEVNQQPENRIENVLINKNWFQGGVCTLNIASRQASEALGRDGLFNTFATVVVQDNIFFYTLVSGQFYVLKGATTTLTMTNNKFSDGSNVTISPGA